MIVLVLAILALVFGSGLTLYMAERAGSDPNALGASNVHVSLTAFNVNFYTSAVGGYLHLVSQGDQCESSSACRLQL